MTPITTSPALDPRTERTLAAVLEAAFRLLSEQGPDGVTHALVAAAANVSRTTIYKHFPTRTDLLRATIEGFMHQPFSALTGDLRTDLRLFLGDLAHDLADDERACFMATMMERAMQDDTVAAVRDGFVHEAEATLRSIIEPASAVGALRLGIDIDRAMADLAGPLIFLRFLKGVPLPDGLIDHVVDGFLAAHRA
jgi:AcrR family transcriptional regulator